jgi:hypothetical protein
MQGIRIFALSVIGRARYKSSVIVSTGGVVMVVYSGYPLVSYVIYVVLAYVLMTIAIIAYVLARKVEGDRHMSMFEKVISG